MKIPTSSGYFSYPIDVNQHFYYIPFLLYFFDYYQSFAFLCVWQFNHTTAAINVRDFCYLIYIVSPYTICDDGIMFKLVSPSADDVLPKAI